MLKVASKNRPLIMPTPTLAQPSSQWRTPTLLFYCQHVLGMGHLMRSRALVEGLVDRFQVCFLNGGELIPGFAFPPAVEVINLPPLKADAAFTGIHSTAGQSLAEIKAARTALILETYTRLQPEILVVELFPFGRKKFAFELMPLLAQIRRQRTAGEGVATKVVCSLRDIMVSRRDQRKHEARACRLLNRYFDLLLVHADPTFQRLEESFGQVDAITTPLAYTGYVAQAESAEETEAVDAPEPLIPIHKPLILGSIGGGRVGSELLASTVAASVQLAATQPHQLLLFGGPYMPDDEFHQLEAAVAGHTHIVLRRYTNRFLHYMAQADLSMSMAGYNTCMNLLTTGTRALLLPFTGGDNDEQSIRAAKLAQMGVAGVLTPADLTPAQLAERITQQLTAPRPESTLDLHGVTTTAARLVDLVTPPAVASRRAARPTYPGAAVIDGQLRPFLDQLGETRAATAEPLHFFLRDDDIDEDEETLRELLDIALARGVPVNLEIIPGRLTAAGIRLVSDHKRFTPDLVGLDQHGWQHTNHEPTGRKCEFGPSRSYEQQYADIAQGKALLAAAFEELLTPVFTPPWNRYTADTLRVLQELGFAGFSGLRHETPVTGYGFQDLSVTLDLYRWKEGAAMKAPALFVDELLAQLRAGAPIGLLLHHKVMDADAFAFLNGLLATLRTSPFIQCHTFATLQKVRMG
ncbi:MAG: hypothetical protein DYG89_37400 [Caldilinea sp. CFX5]|nr:hypothetical protein [Caldilinea sp. CFX5]